jgi:NADP-dependent aldehyde dehydrogenase
MGAGQLCTNPGLILAIDGPELNTFVSAAQQAVGQSKSATMLSSGISSNYHRGVESLSRADGVKELARGVPGQATEAHAAFFSVTAKAFLANSHFSEEVFGPSSVLVRCGDLRELKQVLNAIRGQLTSTLQMEREDFDQASQLLPILERRVGRILVNGWPTGVEVCHAMVHGGPYPSTSDSRTTSVGTLAIERFLRPVCYQDFPSELLPAELRDADTRTYRALIDGNY